MDTKENNFPTKEEIEDFQKRVKLVQDGISKLLTDNELEMMSTYELPRYSQEYLPDEVKLALVVLKNHGIMFLSKFNNLKKKEKTK